MIFMLKWRLLKANVIDLFVRLVCKIGLWHELFVDYFGLILHQFPTDTNLKFEL